MHHHFSEEASWQVVPLGEGAEERPEPPTGEEGLEQGGHQGATGELFRHRADHY